MKKRDIFAALDREFDELTPEMSDELKNAPIICGASVSEKRSPDTAAPARKKHGPAFFRRLTAAVAALAVTVGVAATVLAFLPAPGPDGYLKSDTYISLSINPALSVIADSNGKVTALTTQNRDAEILLAGTDRAAMLGKDYDYVVGYLTGEAVSLGYFAAADGMTIAAVSCGGADKTTAVAAKLKTGAEATLAAGGVTAPVTVGELGRDGLLTAAGQVRPDLRGDEELPDLLAVLAASPDYFEKFGDGLTAVFGASADESVKTLYRMELLEEYAELLEERAEFFADVAGFNAELRGEDRRDDEDEEEDDDEEEDGAVAVQAAFAADNCGFAAPDGWWLTAYVAAHTDAGEDLHELAEDFAELFEDYDEYGPEGLEPLLAGDRPNHAAPGAFAEYLKVYDTVDFEELEKYVDELDDLLDDLNEAEYRQLSALFDDLRARLAGLGADFDAFAASRGEVGGVADYLQKTEQNFRALYDAKKAAASVRV